MSFDRSLLIFNVAAGCIALFIVKFLHSHARKPPLPPGLKGLPLIGNIFDLPASDEKPWLFWQKHKDLYGPISSVTVLGQTIVILNDYDLAVEVLERRSGQFSDRPVFHFGGKMVGWEMQLSISQYGERLNNYRKRVYQLLGTKAAISSIVPIIEIETRRFLLRTMINPSSLKEQLQRLAGAVILRITYGYRIEADGHDRLVEIAERTVNELAHSLTSGKWIVDVIPILRFLPSWFPGAGFKHVAANMRQSAQEFIERPFTFVQHQIATGNSTLCFVTSQLADARTERDEQMIKWCASAIYAGGADTTAAALYTFFLAMTMHPDVMRRAQQEIDVVIGSERFPGLQDRESLPYVEAVLSESLRWGIIGPLAVPHASQEDTTVNGYFIPKGTIVIANSWEFSHKPETYHDPEDFRPERFLKTQGGNTAINPRKYAFGFGRRICPGIELADTELWLQVAMSLAVFDIKKSRDDSGIEITPTCEYTNSIVSHPIEFPCSVTPRSEKAALLVRAVEDEHPQEGSDAATLEYVKWDAEGDAVFSLW